MCNIAFYNCSQALSFVLDSYKTQKCGNKAVGSYPSAIEFVSECYKTHEMCDKALDTCTFVFDSVPD